MKKQKSGLKINFKTVYIKKSIMSCFLACTVMLFSCENDITTINSIVDIKNFPSQSAKNIEILYSDSAVVKLKIIAPEMLRYSNVPEPYIEFPKGIEALFYTNEKTVESRLTSNYAIYFESKEMWEAREDVVVVNKKNEYLNTELLIWDRKKEIFYSDKFVKITSESEIIYGEGFDADQNFINYTIHKPTGVINLNNE